MLVVVAVDAEQLPIAAVRRIVVVIVVEVVDRQGNGRIYPDLEVETPYHLLSVNR